MKRVFLPVLVVAAVAVTGTIQGVPGSATASRAKPIVRVVRPVNALTTIGLTLDFACIHRFEGAWDANTGNGYHGGLQMDARFEATYGPELLRSRGHAENWTPEQQIAVAIRAHRTRGFSPWPNTRRSCGL